MIRLGLGKCNCFERGQGRSILRIPLGRKRPPFQRYPGSQVTKTPASDWPLLLSSQWFPSPVWEMHPQKCQVESSVSQVLCVSEKWSVIAYALVCVIYIYTHYITLHCIALHYITLHYFTYTHTCMHACIHPYTHTSIHACMHTYTYAYIIICIIICNIFGWNLILWNNLYRDRQMNKEE